MLVKCNKVKKKLFSSELKSKCKDQILIFLHIDFNIKSIENLKLTLFNKSIFFDFFKQNILDKKEIVFPLKLLQYKKKDEINFFIKNYVLIIYKNVIFKKINQYLDTILKSKVSYLFLFFILNFYEKILFFKPNFINKPIFLLHE